MEELYKLGTLDEWKRQIAGEQRHIYMPYHRGNHWILIYVRRFTSTAGGQVWFLDPLRATPYHPIVPQLLDFLKWLDGVDYTFMNPDRSCLPTSNLPAAFPRQFDRSSCGILVGLFYEKLRQNEQLPVANMPAFANAPTDEETSAAFIESHRRRLSSLYAERFNVERSFDLLASARKLTSADKLVC